MEASRKIAIVSTTFPPTSCGGVETSHLNLLHAFRSRGYCVRGFTYCDSMHGEEDGILRKGLPTSLRRYIRSLLFFGLRLRGEKGVIYQAADTLICALGAISLIGDLKSFAPDVTIIPDLGAPAAFWPGMGGKTILVAHHNPARFLDQPLFGGHSILDTRIALSLEKRALKKVDAVVSPSRYMAGVFGETYQFDGPVCVIPNLAYSMVLDREGVPTLRPKLGLAPDRPVVYIPSAGSVYKGSRFVFEIIRRIARGIDGDVGFFLTGALDAELESCLRTVPSNAKIHAPGHLPYLQNMDTVRQCSICVSPTLAENFGMAILEAQYCGLPVVTFDVGGNREIVESGTTGHVVPLLDVDGLVERALLLLNGPRLLEEMSGNARVETRRKFSEQVVVDRFIDLFRTLNLQPSHMV